MNPGMASCPHSTQAPSTKDPNKKEGEKASQPRLKIEEVILTLGHILSTHLRL